MLHKIIRAIHYLRVYFLIFITFAFLYVVGMQPLAIGRFVGAKLSRAVGMSVSVPENPFNLIALQLKDKENQLNQKEQELNKKELDLDKTPSNNAVLLYILTVGIGVLFVLIMLNYYFDYRRRKKFQIFKDRGYL